MYNTTELLSLKILQTRGILEKFDFVVLHTVPNPHHFVGVYLIVVLVQLDFNIKNSSSCYLLHKSCK